MTIAERDIRKPARLSVLDTAREIRGMFKKGPTETQITHSGILLEKGVAVSINALNISGNEHSLSHPGSIVPERSLTRKH